MTLAAMVAEEGGGAMGTDGGWREAALQLRRGKKQRFTPVAQYSLLLHELNRSTERPDVKKDALGDVPRRRPSQRDANQL